MAAVLQTAPSLHRLRGFESGAREIDDTPMTVQGRLPEWLRGTFLLNGPALWDLPRGRYEHWFDGLAMLHAVRIGEGQARYRSRFIQSEDYRASVAVGAPAFGGFDTPDPAGFAERIRHLRHPRATDNPAVVMSRIGARWIATTETEHVTAFDADTLVTLGRVAFDDALKMPLMAAHGMTDEHGDYWNVGVELGPKCTYRLFRVRAGSTRREPVASITVPKAGYLHAFARSRRHVLLWEPALRVQALGFLFTRRAYIRNFKWEPGHGSRLHAISLDDGRVRSWDIAPMMCFHAVQAFEDGDGFVLDLCVHPDATVCDDLRLEARRAGAPMRTTPRLTRYRLKAGRPDAQAEVLGDAAFELPQVHAERAVAGEVRWAWGAGAADGFFDRTVRIDLSNGARAEWRRENAVQLEPLHVPRPGAQDEDDGVLLVPTLADGDAATVIAVLDARRMECLASLEAPQVVPFGFHAAFRPA